TYFNGNLKWVDPYVKVIAQSSFPVMIWKRTWTTYYFQGVIDDIKIYNRELTGLEIKQQAKSIWF
ncbi:MAG: hypothetical protein ACD_3C00162G0001, partial [uncultured bacterium (gcode 4)]